MPSKALAHLHFSPDLETLALRLHERLTEERRRIGPFESITILVPNRNVRRWLSMRLADLDGVCASLDFLYLEQGLIRALRSGGGSGFSLASQTDVELELCSILSEPNLAEPLASYVKEGPAARTRQLAARLASLFREYEYHREDWIESWIAKAPDGSEPAMVQAQAGIYRALSARLSARGLSTFYWYAASLMQNPLTPVSRVFVFGISQISRLHARILFHLAESSGFDLYLADFVLSAGAPEQWTEVTPSAAPPTADGGLLAWVRPQRELIRVLERYATNARWFAARPRPRPGGPGFLAGAVLDGSAGKPLPVGTPAGIEIIGAPGSFREVEAVYCDILGRLKADSSLKLTDIAILVPDMKRYRPWVESIFERESPGLSYNLTDFTSAGSSLYARGAECLMDLLMEPEFRRSQIASLLRNVCFQSAMGFDDKQALEWLRIIDMLGAYRGIGHADPFTFSAALRRLRLSYVFSLGDEETYEGIVPRGDPFLAAESAGLLSSVFERLAETVERVRREPPEKLAQSLEDMLRLFLRVPRNLREEARIEEGLFSFLDRLRASELVFPLEMVVELLRADTGAAAGSKGEYLASGVTVAQLQPMRPIPFRITYVLGMEEGSFPGRADESTMNLRTVFPDPNDVSLPDTNKLLFLESMFGARESFVVSYICRDPVRDADYEPCSVVQELIEFAGKCGLALVPRRLQPHLSLPETHPRPIYIPAPEAVLMHLRAGIAVPSHIARAPAEKPRLEPSLPSQARISLKMLVDYLSRPFDAVLKYVARVPSEPREDNSLKDIEPFYSSDYLATTLPGTIVADMLQRGVFTEAAFRESGRRVYGLRVRNLELPPGAFGEADLARMLEDYLPGFQKWRAKLTAGAYVRQRSELLLREDDFEVRIDADFPLVLEQPGLIELVEVASSALAKSSSAGLRSFLYAAVLRALGETRTIRSLLLDKKSAAAFVIPEISTADAKRYLLMICRDLLSADDTCIPLKLLLGQDMLLFRGSPSEFADRIVEELADQTYFYSEFFSILPVHLDEGALALARRRFALYAESRDARNAGIPGRRK